MENMGRVLMFAWKRWAVAERALSRSQGRRARRRAEAACEFWRAVHRKAEATLERAAAPNRLAHAAVARTDDGGHFTRPPDADLPEALPDLPVVGGLTRICRAGGGRG